MRFQNMVIAARALVQSSGIMTSEAQLGS